MKKEKIVIKNTLGMFDLIKGVMLLMMLLGHSTVFNGMYSNLNVVTYLIIGIITVLGEAAMPALFVISGYGLRKTTFTKCVKKQFKILIVPYLITVVVTSIVAFVSMAIEYGDIIRVVKETASLFLGSLFGITPGTGYLGFYFTACGPVWFLVALFFGNIISNQLLRYFEGQKLLVAAFVVSLVGWGLTFVRPLPGALSQSFIAPLYICFGYYAKKHKLFVSQDNVAKRNISIVLVIAVILAHKAMAGEFYMAHNVYTYGPFSIVVNGLAALLFIYWFLHLNTLNGVISSNIRKIGRYSLYLLCIHSILYMAIGTRIQQVFASSWQGSLWLGFAIVLTTRLVVDLFITFIFVRIKNSLTK
ncbi:acyltransferase family protein [Pseudobutyrivibrio xylanivorans]|uniref:Fucose 4-O-acetylase n=1 Tax=Pseudobutyrivibrio xylanivorans TaxID=185007 RepID=A0A1G5S1A5_PSEXY|nr:acyltransferase [Pseudobutyrivibrio xylanivorans]SCZ80144.1 Fucose 4-O-acetylase [Pseudobutyrivibrio xylanivorans]